MARVFVVVGPLLVLLWVFCVVHVIASRDDEVRNLPKTVWLLLVLFFPIVGAVAWWLAGRPSGRSRRRSPYERAAPEFPEYDRPGRAAGVTPESDAEFLRRVRERAEEQRRREVENKRRREAEQQDRRDADGDSLPGDPVG